MRTDTVFRPAAPASTARNLVKTALQCSVIWTVLLVVVPLAIHALELDAGVPEMVFPGRHLVAASLLMAFSALNVGTAMVLVREGRGTPLPLDCPREFVAAGPYRFVRNPMAIAGLGQGLAVAIWLGSWAVLAYVIAGILVWQWVARPAEERDLEARFGDEYRAYRGAVRCWIPRMPRRGGAARGDQVFP